MDPVFRAVVTLGYSGGRRTGKGDHLGTKKKIKKGKKAAVTFCPHQALAVQVRGGGGGGGGSGGRGGSGWQVWADGASVHLGATWTVAYCLPP